MPLNRCQLIRLTTIDRCLQNHYRQWTLNDLIDACDDALYEFEGRRNGVSRRTIQSDIQLMRSEKLGYNAPIIIVDKKYYAYEDKNYSITNIPLSETDINSLSQAMDILKHFQIFSQFSPVADIINKLQDHIAVTTAHSIPAIDLEKNERLKGLNFVSELYDCIITQKCIDIEYQSFKARKARSYTFSPYLLKEFKNRWFVLGYCNDIQQVMLFALDRIISVRLNANNVFCENTFFDPEHYFDDIIGVTKSLGDKVEMVRLWVDADQAPYIQTKPLHASQQVVKQNSDGSIEISLSVVTNLELEREITGYAEHIEILAPRLLRHRISKKLQLAALHYSPRKSEDEEA